MKRLIIALCATIPAALVGGCVGEGYGYGADVYAAGPYAYDGYYDDFYGPIYDGYWGDDGFFWYCDAGRDWHRDEGHHFQRTASNGFNHVRGTGVHREH